MTMPTTQISTATKMVIGRPIRGLSGRIIALYLKATKIKSFFLVLSLENHKSVCTRQTNQWCGKKFALANLHFSGLLSLRPKSTLQRGFGIFQNTKSSQSSFFLRFFCELSKTLGKFNSNLPNQINPSITNLSTQRAKHSVFVQKLNLMKSLQEGMNFKKILNL